MSESETYTVLPYLQGRIEPTEPGVIYAVKLERLDSFGGSEWVEGMGGYFHRRCFPRSSGQWRQKPMPAA